MKRWYFDIKRVMQVNNHGCGIATVATVCGVTYERARHEFFPKKRRFRDGEDLCVDAIAMIKVINKLGFDAETVPDFRKVKDRPVIVPFSWSPYAPDYGIHSVVWDPFKKRFIDPGPDEGNFSEKEYVGFWKYFKYQSVVVTGKKKR